MNLVQMSRSLRALLSMTVSRSPVSTVSCSRLRGWPPGARQLLAQAVELEAEAFLAAMKELKLLDSRDRLVRHGQPAPDGRTWTTALDPERSPVAGLSPLA
jgi:hypothetical protein